MKFLSGTRLCCLEVLKLVLHVVSAPDTLVGKIILRAYLKSLVLLGEISRNLLKFILHSGDPCQLSSLRILLFLKLITTLFGLLMIALSTLHVL
ncbi:hypothetical protein BU24DRAFT_191927 [Aaosphaeria arxii CBS 175.79]|uniref:Uncharacterized protein n=1 Tax=Aaosphaeria arxii CBS 175.79 TaxID=1450172 RepID=A0A6A5XTK6_9PLEO|nr:uncharacterized protein BU24DRAFT_191927 [Aaosphaeria arxii CBS 175.79]KAF2016051.1 hypothetical protein BU24DRAFT_191927 [Aaosphaeria arxii CBS 175.79]